MIFNFGNDLPQYTIAIYIGNAVTIQKLNDQQGLIFITTINGTVI